MILILSTGSLQNADMHERGVAVQICEGCGTYSYYERGVAHDSSDTEGVWHILILTTATADMVWHI